MVLVGGDIGGGVIGGGGVWIGPVAASWRLVAATIGSNMRRGHVDDDVGRDVERGARWWRARDIGRRWWHAGGHVLVGAFGGHVLVAAA